MQLYLSYAEEDEVAGKRLKLILNPLETHFGFTTWSRQDVCPGGIWQREMASHLESAWLFIPLVSTDYLASKRCEAETTAALRLEQRKKLRIVSVLLRTCFLEISPLSAFPILPHPEKPLTTWNNQDKAWLQVQKGILNILKSAQLP